MTCKNGNDHKWNVTGIYQGEGVRAVCRVCGKVFDGRTMTEEDLYRL